METVLSYGLYLLLAIIGLFVVYIFLRIGSLAVFRSWKQVKVEYLKGVWFGRYKGIPPNSEEKANDTEKKQYS